MMKKANQMHRSYSERIREIGGRLRSFAVPRRQFKQRGPDMKLNDGWSAQAMEQDWQEYGDGGDSWWAGAS